ncbi:MAG: carboxypeptidase-like regulatory domain-containing protein, partial [Planctomycetota bacterium]
MTIGEEPLALNLYFGGRQGLNSIELVSDEDGVFSGVLPREGRWEVDLVASSPEIHRRLRGIDVEKGPDGVAEVEIELPDTLISGVVVDEEGRPLEAARVIASARELSREGDPVAPERPATVQTAEDGSFAFRGFEAGTYDLQALAGRNRQSDPLTGSLGEQTPWTGVRLVASEARAWRGRVLSAATGQPVAGALVVPRPHRPDSAIISTQTSTRNDGTFDLRLPSSIDGTNLAIMGRGFELSFVQLGPQAQEEGVEIILHPSRETTVTIPLETHLTMADLVESGGAFPILRDASGLSYDITLLRQWARLQGEGTRGGELRVRGLRPDIYTL